jgi:hypothetical protein
LSQGTARRARLAGHGPKTPGLGSKARSRLARRRARLAQRHRRDFIPPPGARLRCRARGPSNPSGMAQNLAISRDWSWSHAPARGLLMLLPCGWAVGCGSPCTAGWGLHVSLPPRQASKTRFTLRFLLVLGFPSLRLLFASLRLTLTPLLS